MGFLLSEVLKKLKPSLLISLGLTLFFLGASRYYKLRTLSFAWAPDQVQINQGGELPIQITIPSIKVDLPIDVGSIVNGVWQVSSSHATFLGSSARPKTAGNIVIYGHNKKAIFGNLQYLSIGQKVFVKTQSEKIYAYEVYRKEFVKPDRVDLVSPIGFEELTLYTCWGLFDSQRVVIKARPILNPGVKKGLWQ